MSTFVLLDGFVFGLILAVPVGPVGVLCVSRAISEGRLHGLLSGLGAAVADAVYGAVAAFGIGTAAAWINRHQNALVFCGGILLILMAIRTFLYPPRQTAKLQGRIRTGSLIQDFLSSFMLAISNPMTLLAFAGLVVTYGVSLDRSTDRAMLVTGVFIGSAAWWLALSSLAVRFSRHMNGGFQLWVSRISAGILLTFGIYALARLPA